MNEQQLFKLAAGKYIEHSVANDNEINLLPRSGESLAPVK